MATNCPALIPAPQAPQNRRRRPAPPCPGCGSRTGRRADPAPPLHFVGGEQCRPHHYMVLRPVHMAEGQRHHPVQNGDGVGGALRQAQPKDAVHPLGVAAAAYIVAIHAAGLAQLLLWQMAHSIIWSCTRYSSGALQIRHSSISALLLYPCSLPKGMCSLIIAGDGAEHKRAAFGGGGAAEKVFLPNDIHNF